MGQEEPAREEFAPEHQAYLRAEIQKGIEQLNRGEVSEITIEQIIAEESRHNKRPRK